MRNLKRLAMVTAFTASVVGPGVAWADLFGQPLPDPTTSAVQYDDFFSYSLPILNYFATGNTTSNAGDPYYVTSTPGAIQDLIVVYTGSSGSGVTTNETTAPFAQADDAEAAATGSQDVSFTNDNPLDPANGPTGDTQVWDILVGDLQTFLNGGELVFLFNNNQTNSGSAADQTLSIWVKVTLSGVDYFFQQTGGTGDPTDGANYVVAGGQVCLDSTTFVVEVCGADATQVGPFNHNLGANQAAYAIVGSDAFNAALAAEDPNDLMSLTIYMGCTAITTNTQVPCFPLNNGYEQLFIASTTGPNLNPEPGSLALLGLGLIALAWTARKRYR
jgi:hypothetical protein